MQITNLNNWNFNERLSWCTAFIVLSFACVFVLGSQSAASFGTYALTILVLATYSQWRDVWDFDLIWWIALLLAFLVLSCFWSTDFQWRSVFSITVRAILIFAFVIAVAETQLRGRTQRWLSLAITVVGFFAALGAFYYYVKDPPWDGRLVGLGQLDNNVIAGLVFAVAALFSLRLLLSKEYVGLRLFGGVAFAVLAIAVTFTGSRNAIMGLCAGVVVLITTRLVDTPQKFFAVLLPSILLVAVGLYVLTLTDYADQIFPRGDSFRLAIWGAALEEIANSNILWGRGILTSDEFLIDGVEFAHPHSMYISVLYQGGAIALGLFVLLIGRVLNILLTHFHDEDAKFALAILAISLPAYLFDEHELVDKVGSTWLLFWLPVACALGVQWRPGQSRASKYGLADS